MANGSEDERRPEEPTIIERIESVWRRSRDHKVIQWALGYFGVAFVLAQVEQIIAQTYNWPAIVGRVFITFLLVLLPIAVTIAWYQGYRGLRRFNRNELAVIVVLLLTGAGTLFFVVPARDVLIATAPGQPVSSIGLKHVAVFPFNAVGTGQAESSFSRTIEERIVARLNDNQIQTISETDAASLRGMARDSGAMKLGADFIVSGTVESAHPLRVTVHLDRASTHATVWSASYDQSGSDVAKFQTRVAGAVLDIVQAALHARSADPSEMDDAALGIFLKYTANSHATTGSVMFQQRDLARSLIARAPKFSDAYSGFAMVSALLLDSATPGDMTGFIADIKKAAAQALALDPKNAEAYLALAAMLPQDRWEKQEAIYRKGLAVAPDNPTLSSYLADVYIKTGRSQEAIEPLRRAVFLDPQSPPKMMSLAGALSVAGHGTEAKKVSDNAYSLWPDDEQVWFERFAILADGGFPDDALAMLNAPNGIPDSWEPEYVAVWHAYLTAQKANLPANRAAALTAARAALTSDKMGKARALMFFAGLRDVDDAFELMNRLLAAPGSKLNFSPEILFYPQTLSMRRDARFMSVAARMGLAGYWIRTRNWPDFCAQPGLPYDCRAAAKAAISSAASTTSTGKH